MISDKRHIQQLAVLLLKKGITDIVISPGSRNAPLINTFTGTDKFNCRNIVDERTAAYFALGLALKRQNPVVLVCSSGTAALNYVPAVAEAYYQNIPLIVLTADRPNYWIDQAESQCIRQENIYQNFTKKGISLPLGESEKELWFSARQINECLTLVTSGKQAPVHINIPLEEPLHKLVEEGLPEVKEIELARTQAHLTEIELATLVYLFSRSRKTIILAGQMNPSFELKSTLSKLVDKTGAVVIGEHLANISNPRFCSSIDLLMTGILDEDPESYQPDLLISFGGQFVSKSLKQFLRKNKPSQHWHISLDNEHFDTYQSLTKVINMKAIDFFEALLKEGAQSNRRYLELWKNKEAKLNQQRDQFIKGIEFCDLKAFGQIVKTIPLSSVIHLGNSSPVRYGLIHEVVTNAHYLSNRGTAGIDGCLSTAVGFASASDQLNTIILGDLSFFYDSNALWNKYIGSNLRIIVIHNGGGNIFGMIKGPADSPAYNEHFFAENTHKAEVLAKAFDLDYFKAEDEDELTKALKKFYSPSQKKVALLEIFTNAEINSRLFRELFSFVKTKQN
ncbi:MAG TPA: 2-succinyl-5-enolpyruvyl-6-hydroxy-3-cyclohexene-1-carboxylic-acid synthase [Prolixibacteraceae bacterium]|jgi:2-succinyl-5-enolpyruvyl-6-hydroxy-3-cyclohexene-1-carboxylate synthase|nr:2-succinyl-5-enolpyruvyl-6-hydroxy-3-cyclohexene-1-carboxylic-acid synthase [Prolixibacteraceae bacterium]